MSIPVTHCIQGCHSSWLRSEKIKEEDERESVVLTFYLLQHFNLSAFNGQKVAQDGDGGGDGDCGSAGNCANEEW